jgi:hypothetical protein
MGATGAIVNRTRRAVDGEKRPAHGGRSFRIHTPGKDINCPGTGTTILTSGQTGHLQRRRSSCQMRHYPIENIPNEPDD